MMSRYCPERQKANIGKLKAKGICRDCKTRKTNGSYALCDRCREMSKKRNVRNRKRLNDDGLCSRCGGMLDGDYVTCVNCCNDMVYSLALRRMRRNNG